MYGQIKPTLPAHKCPPQALARSTAFCFLLEISGAGNEQNERLCA